MALLPVAVMHPHMRGLDEYQADAEEAEPMCKVKARHPDAAGGELYCWRGPHDKGVHWDAVDRIAWSVAGEAAKG